MRTQKQGRDHDIDGAVEAPRASAPIAPRAIMRKAAPVAASTSGSDDTFAAAKHASEQGWIEASALDAVHEEKRADEGKTGEKADVPGVPEDPKAPTVVVE